MMVDLHNTRITGTRVDHDAQPRRPRCPYCGKPYTPKDGVEGCRSCRRIGELAGYMPTWDAGFVDRYAVLVIMRCAGSEPYLRPSDVPCTSEDAKWARRVLERWGFRFESDPHLGSRLVGWSRRKEEA